MSFDHGLKDGDTLTNRELIDLFKCGNMGGMRHSKTTNTLILVADSTRKFYHDKWIGDELHYTGMGKTGNQSLMFMQNRTLAESYKNQVDVYLFEVKEKGKYTYKGRVALAGEPYQEEQKDFTGKMRNVWIFPLKVIN